MIDLNEVEGVLQSRFVFPESFIGFQGHFPDNKILPGVCQIQCALATLKRARQKSVQLQEVVLAKYYVPVSPGEEILCRCIDIPGSDAFTFKAIVTKGSIKVSELKLRVVLS